MTHEMSSAYTCNIDFLWDRYWWNAAEEPFWGDHTSLLASDGNVYLFGGTNTTLFYDGVYVARVPHASQQDLSAYEYWNGSAYTPDRIYNPSETQAVLGPNSSQGQIAWNPYLNLYLYVYTGDLCKTSLSVGFLVC
jgi:hypothetical protein